MYYLEFARTGPLTQLLCGCSVKDGGREALRSDTFLWVPGCYISSINLWPMMPSEAWGGTRHCGFTGAEGKSMFDDLSEREIERSTKLLWDPSVAFRLENVWFKTRVKSKNSPSCGRYFYSHTGSKAKRDCAHTRCAKSMVVRVGKL